MAKVFKDSPDAPAGMAAGIKAIRINGTKENYVLVDNFGTTISGPISIVAGLNQVRTGALWTFNGEMQLSIPSTLATPTPVLKIDPPLKQIKGIVEAAALFIALFPAIGG